MKTKLTAEAIYVGTCTHIHPDDATGIFVVGVPFGPMLLAVHCSLQEAIDEYDERHGQRVEPDDAALAYYPGETIEQRYDAAINCGDIRVNDGGTTVWVDHCEWCRSFRTVRDAGKFFREN
jgi:hypothetical protein